MWFRRVNFLALLLVLTSKQALTQELFPLNQPASSIPKGVIGVQFLSENYKEVSVYRSLDAIRLMYGLTSKLSIIATTSISNHHNTSLPPDLINHTHSGPKTSYYTQNFKRGVKYPFLYNGLYLYAKYRILSFDGTNKHLRIAGYGEWSDVGVAHDEAEPNLMDDTGGYGYGMIVTLLKNRFAASFNGGIEKPMSYFEYQPDLTGGPDLPTKIIYGDAIKYNLSFGYRRSPEIYTDYDQPNWNVYLEFMGKAYQTAKVFQNGNQLEINTVALRKGAYLEVHPGIQRIVKSNLRIDLSAGFSLLGKSYAHFTPVLNFGIQRYFYKPDKNPKNPK